MKVSKHITQRKKNTEACMQNKQYIFKIENSHSNIFQLMRNLSLVMLTVSRCQGQSMLAEVAVGEPHLDSPKFFVLVTGVHVE